MDLGLKTESYIMAWIWFKSLENLGKILEDYGLEFRFKKDFDV
jgi:hypothetical protein